MPSSLIPLCTPIDAGRVLDAAWLLLPGGLSRSAADGYRIRLGTTGADGKPSWFSIFDTHQQAIPEGGVVKVTSTARLGRRLVPGGTVLAEVVPYGSPVLPAQLCAQILVSPITTIPAHRVHDPAMRDAVDSLSDYSRGVGSGEQWIVKTLAVPEGAEALRAHDENSQTVSATSYTNGNVSVTATKPAWARYGIVNLTAHATFSGAGGAASTLYVEVYDGTTGYDEHLANTSASNITVSTSYGVAITATTTFTLRMKKDGAGANADVIRQTLAGSVVWI